MYMTIFSRRKFNSDTIIVIIIIVVNLTIKQIIKQYVIMHIFHSQCPYPGFSHLDVMLVECYDPKGDQWNILQTPILEGRSGPGCAVLDDSIYLVGGYSWSMVCTCFLQWPFRSVWALAARLYFTQMGLRGDKGWSSCRGWFWFGFQLVQNMEYFFSFVLFYLDELLSDCVHWYGVIQKSGVIWQKWLIGLPAYSSAYKVLVKEPDLQRLGAQPIWKPNLLKGS